MTYIDGFVAGSVAGATGLLIGHPFDTIKVRLQTTNIYKGVTHCCRKIIAEEGVRALYKGLLSPLWSVSAMNAVFFGVYTTVLKAVDDDLDMPKISSTYIAGTASGLLAGFISGPTELIKCRMQVSGMEKGAKAPCNITTIRNILSTDGVRGLGRGLGVTVLRETISSGIYFATYEAFIQAMRGPDLEIHDISTAQLILAGGLSGMLSWGINYPIDMIKSRVQVDGMSGPRLYRSSYHCYTAVLTEGGATGLYRGLSSTLVRAFPTNAAMLPAYSITMTLITSFRCRNQKDEGYD